MPFLPAEIFGFVILIEGQIFKATVIGESPYVAWIHRKHFLDRQTHFVRNHRLAEFMLGKAKLGNLRPREIRYRTASPGTEILLCQSPIANDM
jgi:hypothetical protein